jgi:hypothetical protein
MSLITPPAPPPDIALDDGDGMQRLRLRLQLILMTALTILITGWFCTLGVFPAILALMVAKHVLVALLVVALEAPDRQRGAA